MRLQPGAPEADTYQASKTSLVAARPSGAHIGASHCSNSAVNRSALALGRSGRLLGEESLGDALHALSDLLDGAHHLVLRPAGELEQVELGAHLFQLEEDAFQILAGP